MSINLFKTQQLKYSPIDIKRIYFYLYREINKEVARKQNKIMLGHLWDAYNLQDKVSYALGERFGHSQVRITKVYIRRYKPLYEPFGRCGEFWGPREKDGYRMFKAERCVQPHQWRERDSLQVSYKQIRLEMLTVKELRGMLRMNKIKGRSKLKTKRKIIVALMKM